MSIQYAGGTVVNATFTTSTKATMQASVISNLLTAGWSQATGPSGGGAQTFTITIASPGVLSLAAHGLLANDSFVPSTTGALPTGMTAGTRYFVKTVLTSGTFTFSTTSGGTAVNTTGSQSGVQTLVGSCRMQTAVTPWSVSARVNIQDIGGNCVTFGLENSTSTLGGSTSGANLLPSVNPFRILACKYQAFIFQPITTAARAFAAFGTLYIPPFLQASITQCGWLVGNSDSDTDATIRISLRTRMTQNTNPVGSNQVIINTNVLDLTAVNTGTQSIGAVQLPYNTIPLAAAGQTGYHWGDASALMTEPLVLFSVSAYAGEALIRGQMWNAVLVADTFAGDTTTTFDGHDWWAITDNDSSDKATLFVTTT